MHLKLWVWSALMKCALGGVGGRCEEADFWYSISAFRTAHLHSLVSIQTAIEPDLISLELKANFATSASDRFWLKLII